MDKVTTAVPSKVAALQHPGSPGVNMAGVSSPAKVNPGERLAEVMQAIQQTRDLTSEKNALVIIQEIAKRIDSTQDYMAKRDSATEEDLGHLKWCRELLMNRIITYCETVDKK